LRSLLNFTAELSIKRAIVVFERPKLLPFSLHVRVIVLHVVALGRSVAIVEITHLSLCDPKFLLRQIVLAHSATPNVSLQLNDQSELVGRETQLLVIDHNCGLRVALSRFVVVGRIALSCTVILFVVDCLVAAAVRSHFR